MCVCRLIAVQITTHSQTQVRTARFSMCICVCLGCRFGVCVCVIIIGAAVNLMSCKHVKYQSAQPARAKRAPIPSQPAAAKVFIGNENNVRGGHKCLLWSGSSYCDHKATDTHTHKKGGHRWAQLKIMHTEGCERARGSFLFAHVRKSISD